PGQPGVVRAPAAGRGRMNARPRIGFLLHPGEQQAVRQGMARAQACGFDVWTALDDVDAVVAENAPGTALLVTIGGDGTFLYGARLAAPLGIPVMGANRGRLGFLNDVEIAELPEAISRFASATYHIQKRSRLESVDNDVEHVARPPDLNEDAGAARDPDCTPLPPGAGE